MKSTPTFSKARTIRVLLLSRISPPFSKARTVTTLRPVASANAPCVQSSKARAARHWADVLDTLLALYAAPGTWSRQSGGGLDLEAALWKVIGDPEEDGIGEGEARRREALLAGTFEACGADLVALEAAARRQDVVVAVLRAGRERLAA